jgi:hypothetical protein
VPDGWPDGVARQGRTECPTGCPTGGQTGWPNGGPDGVPDGARRGGGRKDYLLLKEKMTCSIYVSCKSLSASDVSDARWM